MALTSASYRLAPMQQAKARRLLLQSTSKPAIPGSLLSADGTTGAITLTSKSATPFVIGGSAGNENATEAAAGLTFGTPARTTVLGVKETGIDNLNVSTAEDSTAAMDAIDTALEAVNLARGTLGAVQSRFENTIASIQVSSESLSAARGRIMDADFAQETANLSRAQILQQAGTAMVAQANQLPQQVLQLLKG